MINKNMQAIIALILIIGIGAFAVTNRYQILQTENQASIFVLDNWTGKKMICRTNDYCNSLKERPSLAEFFNKDKKGE